MTYACYLLVTWALVHLFFAVNTDGTHVFLKQVGIPNKGIAKLHGDCPACLTPSCLDDRDCGSRLVHDVQDCITITMFSLVLYSILHVPACTVWHQNML